MDQKLTPKEMLCETMYVMFKDNHLKYLDMEDFIVMWQTLAKKWDCDTMDDDWEEFAEEINSVASNKRYIFNEIFENHF